MSKRHVWMIILVLVIAGIWFAGCLQSRENGPGIQATVVQQTIAALSAQFTITAEAPLADTATLQPSTTPRPTQTATPTEEVCTSVEGTIELREIVIPETTRTLAFRVYLPPCYAERWNYDYPVLYLLHGQSSTDDQWDRLGVDEAADQLISTGQAQPFLIVMPYEYYYLQDPRESVYGDQLVNNLIPWVDEEYDTCDLRECRAIGGLSRGAGWAIHLGFTEWELFGSVGAHSLALFQGDFYSLPDRLNKITDDAYPRVYMDDGSLDYMLESAGNFERQLTRYHVPHEWVINNGAHNEEYWAAHVEDYLIWYTSAWKTISADSVLPTATQTVEEQP